MNKEEFMTRIPEQISPYGLSKVESELRGIKVPPQKIYNYVRKGYIKVEKNTLDKYFVTKKEVEKYLDRFFKNEGEV